MAGKLQDKDMKQLEIWIGTGPKTFTLLYKITKDGCNSTTFHQKCDDQGATVTVLYNRQGSVFGGYISQSWNSSGKWNGDENTFLYQLHFNGSSTARKFPCKNTAESYYGCSTYGPTFGIAHDLFTFKHSIARSGEYFALNGYMHFGRDYDSKGIQADQINNGNMNVVELEVYKLTNIAGKLLDKDMNQLKQWIGSGPKTFTLLYKITRDGCNATTFHQKCDDQGATVTVLYNRQGSVFGGYISQSWNSSGKWIGDENAFLYQLHFNGSSTAKKFPCKNTTESFYGCSTHGPTFGIAHDLFTFKHSVAKSDEYFALNGYMHFGRDYDSKGIQVDQINNGNMNVMELEVYKLTSMARHLQDKDMKQLEQWIGTGSKTFTLLYKITRDGCLATTFHQKCDDQGATVTVLYNRQGSVFGGYISQSWNSSGKWIGDENAFLYQLHLNGFSTARKFPCKNTTENYYGCSTHGPTFGIGHDLFTFKHSIAKSDEYFALNGYMHFGRDYESKGIQADQINNGNMDVVELEVYKLTNIAGKLQNKDMKQLEQWIGTGAKAFTLLYKITTDGCHATTFHQKCDDQGPTVTVLYNRQGSVFGGYISQSWNRSDKWMGDENAFLYQLHFNGSSTARKFPCTNTTKSYFGRSTHGPTFGIAHDLFTFEHGVDNYIGYFALNGNMNGFGSDFDSQGIQANQINNGNMDVIELEVYRVATCFLPVEILRMDKHSIELYKHTLEEGKEAVHTIRVMVVGHYGVGKTALTRRLLGKHVDINTRESTNGIEVHIRRCKVSLEDGKWTVLKKNEKSENTFKRLAKLIALQELRKNTSDQSESSVADDTDDFMPYVEDNLIADVDIDTTHLKVADDLDSIPDSVTAMKLTVTPVESDTEHDHEENTDTVETIDEDTIMKQIKNVVKEANKLNDSDSDYADLSIWDFGGQFAFYGTHQVFLSARAVYLLVTDVSKHIQDVVVDDDCYFDCTGSKYCKISEFVEFWLNSIHGYCGSQEPGVPPVILVGTHGDKLDQDNKEEQSEQYFEALRHIVIDKVTHGHLVEDDYVINNAIVDPTLTQLRDKIYEVASQQQYWGELIPARWITLEKALVELTDEGLKICERKMLQKLNQALPVPLSSNEEIDLFLRFQHDSGNMLYFSDLDYVLLDPQWLVDAFKCIITAKMFLKKKPAYKQWQEFNKTAKLKQELIDAVWKTKENMCFHDHRDHLLALLERLDIIARPRSFIEDESQTKIEDFFFAPCVLKDPPLQEVIQPCSSTSDIATAHITTSRLCFTLTTTFLTVAMFNRLMASCLTKWPVSQQCKKDLIFCGCGVFDVDRLHRLTLFFNQNVIQIWITKFAVKKPNPSEEVCTRVRKFIAGTLSKIQKQLRIACEIKISITCPRVHVRSEVVMFDLEDFLTDEEVSCRGHDNRHELMSADMLRYWNFEGACCEDESPGATELPKWLDGVIKSDKCDHILTDKECICFANTFGFNWEFLGGWMGIDEALIQQIKLDHQGRTHMQIYQMLIKWRKKNNEKAILSALLVVLKECPSVFISWDKIKEKIIDPLKI